MTTNDEEREYMIEMLGMARANFRTLAALVSEGNITAARAMIAAIRDDSAQEGVRLDVAGGEARLTGWVVQHLAMATAAHLDALPAPNHCAWTVTFPARDGKPARELDLVAQWSGGVTTSARITRAEAERDALRAAVRELAAAELAAEGATTESARDLAQRRVDCAFVALCALVPGPTEGGAR